MKKVIGQFKSSKRLQKGTAIHNKGQERAHEILKAARHILINEGYANFTIRNICSTLDISTGNLNYYFRNKHDIIHALIEETIQNYEVDYRGTMQDIEQNGPKAQFIAHIDYLIGDLKKSDVRGFFLQLYGMSTHDEYADQYRAEFYEYGINILLPLITLLNPEASKKTVYHKALLIVALIEGMMVVKGPKNEVDDAIQGFENEFRKQALNIALS